MGEAVDQPSRQKDACADAYAKNERIPDRDLVQRHRLLAHEKERGKPQRCVGDELCGTRCERDESKRRSRHEHPKHCREARFFLVRRVGDPHLRVRGTAPRLPDRAPYNCSSDEPRGTEQDKRQPPVIRRGDLRAERHTQRLADGRAEVEQSQRRAAPSRREVV